LFTVDVTDKVHTFQMEPFKE